MRYDIDAMLAPTDSAAGYDLSSPQTALLVLGLLRRLMDRQSRVACSSRQIAAELNIGLTTAANALRRLVASGQIELLKRGTGNEYPSVWRVTA